MAREENNIGHVVYRLANEVNFTYLNGPEATLTRSKQQTGFVFTNFLGTKAIAVQPVIEVSGDWKTVSSAISKEVFTSKKESAEDSTSKDDYDFGFRIIQNEIDYKKISKAILSRKIVLNTNTNCLSLFRKMAENYPTSHIFLVQLSNDEIWIGATPETLLDVEGENGTTMSLAGTKNVQESDWTKKEYEEQSIVTETIIKNLLSIHIKPEIKELETIQAGPVFHLRNVINFKMKDQSPLEIANQLHPTPAISGFPKLTAISTIKIAENHDREFYCGYGGPIKNGRSTLFVNLRCAKITSNQIALFIGSGITKSSVLDKEWEECSRKAQAILNFL